jgi:hypothetical protein
MLFAIERDKRMVMYRGVEAVVAYFSTLSLETLEYKIFKQYSQQCA